MFGYSAHHPILYPIYPDHTHTHTHTRCLASPLHNPLTLYIIHHVRTFGTALARSGCRRRGRRARRRRRHSATSRTSRTTTTTTHMGAADATASRERRDDGDVTDDDDVNDDVEHVNIIKVGYALTAKKASRMLSDALVARCR